MSNLEFWENELRKSQKSLEQYLKWLDNDPQNVNLQNLARLANNQSNNLAEMLSALPSQSRSRK